MRNHCKGILCTGALAVAVCVLLSGCASFLWEREFYERSAHPAQAEEPLSPDALLVHSEEELRSTIISIIRTGLTEAEIRVNDYPGDLRSDLGNLLQMIQYEEPIGAYTVRFFSHYLTPVLSNYILTLNITYRQTEPPEVQMISGTNELRQKIAETLLGYLPSLTVEMRYFDPQQHDLEEMVRLFCDENPAWSVEIPSLTVNFYPAEGDALHRIVDLTLDYTETGSVLSRKTEETDARAAVILETIPDFPPLIEGEEPGRPEAQKLLWLHDALCAAVLYDTETYMLEVNTSERQGGDSYTAYGALVNGRAVGEGYAMAFKLLCDELGLECRIVRGRVTLDQWNNSVSQTWNLVRIGETWYHVSAGLDDRGPTPVYDYFLFSDEAFSQLLLSDIEGQVPAALPGVWSYEALAALGGEEDMPDGEQN